MGIGVPGASFSLDPHIEERQVFSWSALTRGWVPRVRPLCTFYAIVLYLVLPGRFGRKTLGVSAGMPSGCRALHCFSIHILKNASFFSFVRACSTTKITPSTAFSDVTVVSPSGSEVRAASLQFYRDCAIFCLARSVSDVSAWGRPQGRASCCRAPFSNMAPRTTMRDASSPSCRRIAASPRGRLYPRSLGGIP